MADDIVVLPPTPEELAEMAARKAMYDRLRKAEGAELAAGILELIEENESRWNQGSWRYNGLPEERYEAFRDDPLNPECKTAFCGAGWVVAIDGAPWYGIDKAWNWTQANIATQIKLDPAWSRWDTSNDQIGHPDRCDCETPICTNATHAVWVSTYAASRLNLSASEADIFFNGQNTLADLGLLVDAMRRQMDLNDIEPLLDRNGENEARSDDDDEDEDEQYFDDDEDEEDED